MNSQPFNDDPDHVPIKKFRFIMILGFLNFHRRFIVGAILLAGVAYFLIDLNQRSRRGDKSKTPAVANVNSSLSAGERSVQLKKELANVSPLAPESTDQKLNELLDTSSDWTNLSDSRQIEFYERRLEKIRELLQAEDLDPPQRSYCQINFIDTVSMLTGVSKNTDAGIEGIAELVAEVEQRYGKSEEPNVAAAAKLFFVHHALLEFVASRSELDFEIFKNALQERRAAILASSREKLHLCTSINEAVLEAGDDPGLRKIAMDLLPDVVDLRRQVVTNLATNLYFSEVELETLPGRVRDQDAEVDAEVQRLIEQLKKHPNVPVYFYAVLVTTIAQYRLVGDADKAEHIVEELQAIAPRITAKRSRNEILKGIDRL